MTETSTDPTNKPEVLMCFWGGVCWRNRDGRGGTDLDIAHALTCLGYQPRWPEFPTPQQVFGRAKVKPWLERIPSAAVMWNGREYPYRSIKNHFRHHGVPFLIAESGFSDRENYTQVDHAGFHAEASWSHRLTEPCPPEGVERFRRAWGRDIVPVRPRRKGYVLLLLQSAGDEILHDGEPCELGPFVRAVERATPEGIEIRSREHPSYPWCVGTCGRVRALGGGSLEGVVAGARLAVTVSSNSSNEALALGCPVVTVGRSLAGLAGAALMALEYHNIEVQRSLRDRDFPQLPGVIRDVLDGWVPEQSAVDNLLGWLGCRQWTSEELRQPELIANLLQAAGVEIPDRP